VRTGSDHIQVLAPAGVELEREDPLDRLGASGPGHDERLQRLAELAQPGVGMLAVPRGGAVDPVERRGEFQDLAPRFEEVMIDDLGGISGIVHQSRPPSPRGSTSIMAESVSPCKFPISRSWCAFSALRSVAAS
jgi:hypothetical protein